MKKRLEAELISIAHRILKLKNHSELKQLHLETQKLYETLSVLKFVEENINIIQPKIDVQDLEQKLETAFDKNNEIPAYANEEIVPNEIFSAAANDAIIDQKTTPIDDIETVAVANDEIFEEIKADNKPEILAVANDEILEEETIIAETNENYTEEDSETIEKETDIFATANDATLDDEIILKESEPEFVPAFELEIENPKPQKATPIEISFDEFKFAEPIFEKKSDAKEIKPTILNEKLSKGINVGLNDRIAFVKHLFGESNEDFNRVLSQISTFDTYLETVNFINDIVKPDYNNWLDKDEYVLRFMEAVEKKFI